ncbi:hypothetical protein VTK26DRAFT_2950 [Humicola hyalothermophila]
MRAISYGIIAAAIGGAAAGPLAARQEGNATIECPPIPSPWPTWQQLPRQSSMPDPFLPLRYTTTDNAGSSSTFEQDVMTGKAPNRVRTREEWYRCRRPEILQMLQEYQYGYYPDHSQETVAATRSGNTFNVTVAANGKLGSFWATVKLPTTGRAPYPVVINIGGMQDREYLAAGIAVAQFDYPSVAPDSNAKTGAFWDLYNGRDIGVLTAWAWGFHRTLDAINMTVPEIDATRVGVTGCSRLGKAALAAGLLDERITLTMPMASGVQGAGPYRYYTMSGQGENLENSKAGAGWWTNSKLGTFVNHHENLPFDAHTIAAAIAPRALIIHQTTGDQFTNSKGTAVVVFPAAKAVYDWLGVGDKIAIKVTRGPHCDVNGHNAILPYVKQILLGEDSGTKWDDLGAYGSATTTAFPWATATPPAA